MTPRPLSLLASLLTVALCVIWGFNQVVVKLALPEVGPIAQTGLRSAIGAVCVAAYAAISGRRVFRIDGSEVAGVVVGFLFTVEFIALYESLRWTTASRATVFIYAAPFFVALGAILFLRDERLRPGQWLGLALAFAGLALGFLDRTSGGGRFGDGLALFAALAWAATTIVIKATPLRRADPIKVLLYQIGFAAIAAPFATLALGEPLPTHISVVTAAALLWQGVIVVGLTYALWFWLIAAFRAPQLFAFTLITPLVGVLAGFLVFGEALTAGFAAAIALVIAGLAFVNWPQKARVSR